MKTFLSKPALLAITLLLASFFFSNSAFGQAVGDYRTVSNGPWSTLTTWERFDGALWVTPTAPEGYPGENAVPAVVTLRNLALSTAIQLDVSPANSIGSLLIAGGNQPTGLTFTGTNSLTVNGAITINAGTGNADNKTIAVAGGSLSSASVTIANTGNDNRTSSITVSTGTVTVTGNITMGASAVRNFISVTSTGTLNAGGTLTGGNLTTAPGSTINYNGTNQTVRAISYYGNLILSGSGTKTLTGVTAIDGNFTLSGSATTTAAAALSIGGTVTLGAGTTFTAGAFTHDLSGSWVNNGAIFNNTGSTINLNGNPQSIGGSVSTTFNNLTFSNAGTKTLSIATFISGDFAISGPAIADLGSITTHTANTITLEGVDQPAGTYGSTASAATNQNDTYFALTSGFITGVSQAPVTYFSRANGDWNSSATWSTVGFGSAVNVGTFPAAGDIVNMGGGRTVTVTANAACASITYNAAAANNTVIINSGFTLAVSGAITIPRASFGFVNLVNVGPGTLNAGSIAFPTGGTDPRHRIEISTGTVTVTGNVTGSAGNTSGTILFTGAGLLQLGGAGTGSIYAITDGTLTTVSGSTVEYNGAAQTVRSHSYLGTLLLSGSGVKTFTNTVAGGTIPGNLTMSGSATATAPRALTIGGTVTLGLGTTFTAGSFTHNVAGNWINNGGTFNDTGSTINLNGTAQNIGGSSSTAFNNLTLSVSGTKTFGIPTFVEGILSITGTAQADLGSFTNHIAYTLSLSGVTQVAGTYGSTASSATNQNNTYFTTPSTGILTVPGDTFYSRQTGNWNDNNTWSFTPGGPAVGAGIFPDVDDIVFIQGNNITVTVTGANATCDFLIFPAAASNRTVTIASGFTLDVTGEIVIPRANAGALNLINVGPGTLNAGIIAFTNGGGGGGIRHQITISTGTVTVTGDITTNIANAGANITFTGGAGTLNAGVGIFTTAPAGGTLTTVTGSTVNYNGAAQTVKPIVYNGNLTLSGSGTKTMTGVTTIAGNFTLSGTATATPTAALTIGGTVTLESGTIFTAGAFTHNVAGNWINNGTTFTNTGNTINFNGTAQAIGGSNTTTFNNLTLANTGTKSFGIATVTNGTFSISGTAIADLGLLLNHTAGTLILGGTNQAAGTYGSTASLATTQNDTYFANTGILTVSSENFYSIATGDWTSNIWSFTPGGPALGLGVFPVAGDNVNIVDGFTVTVAAPAACSTLTFGAANNSNTVTINSGITLDVSGTITIPRATNNGQTNTLAVGAGTLNAASIKFTNGGAGAGIRHRLTISTGILTVTGDITTDNLNAGATLNLNGAGTINAGVGIFTTAPAGGTFTTATNSTVNYNGATQTVKAINYLGNLTLSGTGVKTLLAGTTTIGGNLTLSGTASTTTVVGLIISGNLALGDGTAFTAAGFPLTVGGTTTIGSVASGQLSISSATGLKRFTGLVTIATGGTWDNSTANSPVFFGGGITNNGTFSAGTGLHTFDNTSQVLTGIFSIPNVTVTGVTVTNTNTLTIATALSGTGALTQASNATLNIGGTSGITTLTASAAGNTVNYNGTLNQAIKEPVGSQYANLSFNGTTAAGIASAPAASTLFVSENWVNNGTGVSGAFTGFNPNGGTIVFNGTTIVSGSSTTSLNNVQLTAASALTFPAGVVNVSGNIDFDGSATFTNNQGTIIMNGTSAQTIDVTGADFNNLTVNNGGNDVQLLSALDLISLLDVQSASNFISNGFLTLRSTSDSPDVSASINPLLGGAQVSGSVNTQRYMSGENRIYRYISSPVSGASIAQWMDDFSVTGPFADPSTVDPITGLATFCGFTIKPANASLFYYTESVAGTFDNGWVGYPTVSSADPIVAGRGYSPFIRQCTDPTLITVSGTINQGAFDYGSLVTYTNSGSPANDGWNLIGNPYPSAIRWDANGSGWTKGANITTTAFVRDNGNGGVFLPVSEGDVIAQGQAFWIQANGADVTLILDETAKVSSGATFYRKAVNNDLLVINLTNEGVTDKAYFKVERNARTGYDKYDAANPDNIELFDVATSVGTMQLAVNSVNSITSEDVINVHIKDMEAGTYSFNVDRDGVFAEFYVILKDKYTGTMTEVTAVDRYEFSITSDMASKAADRFEIHLAKDKMELTSMGEKSPISLYPNPVEASDELTIEVLAKRLEKVHIINAMGAVIATVPLTEQDPGVWVGKAMLTELPSGMYYVRVIADGKNQTEKFIRSH